jgi:transglutaminase-like putative cysteine protease
MSDVAAAARRRDQLVVATEVALGLVTMAAIVGMHRLFVDGSYRGALVLQALVAHLAVTLLRRAGVRLVPAAIVTAGLAILFITWSRFPDTTRWLLPTPDTIRQLGDDLTASWKLFGDVDAPAPVHNGFVVATAGAIWVIAFVADWAAFRVSATFEALLPATTLFVFAAALGGPGSPVASAALFCGAALLYVLLHRTSDQERSSRWAGGHRNRGRWSLVGTGATIIGVAVLAGAVAGPQLPGADAEPLLAWQDINKDKPTRVVLSPMVSLQTKLVEQPDVEVFTVRSEQSSYWRLTSLDEFDGEIWRSSYSTDDATGELPRALDPESTSQTVTQEITIEALSSVWLPAAFEPVAVDVGDQATDFDERSSTLMVDRDVTSSDGYTYTVTSQVPELDDDELRTASTAIPDDIAATYRQLPPDFPERVRTEAERVAGDQATPFDQALALQRYLRSSQFTYDLNVGPGHSEQALLTFLFESRRGYCEQFASAFAAMARAAGLPARVAVGFTPGVQDLYDPTLFRVRGVHAHAWPEVYLGEFGWVPFEPTPDRGPPGAGSWLGIAESQDTSTGGVAVTDPDAPGGAGNGNSGSIAGASGDDQRDPGAGLGEDGLSTSSASSEDSSPLVPEPVRDASRPVGVGLAGYLILVPIAVVGQRFIRRRRARTPAAKTRLWWRNATETAMSAGVELPEYLTIAEMADRLSTALPDSSAAVQELARDMEMIAYAELPPSESEVADSEEGWAAVVAQAKRRQTWGRRILTYFDIRQLFAARGERLVAHQGPAPNPASASGVR